MEETEKTTWAEIVARFPDLPRKWDEAIPAPEFPAWVEAAFDGCLVHCGFDISALDDVATYNAVLIAALDAEPQGIEAAEREAAERLRSIAIAEGWSDILI